MSFQIFPFSTFQILKWFLILVLGGSLITLVIFNLPEIFENILYFFSVLLKPLENRKKQISFSDHREVQKPSLLSQKKSESFDLEVKVDERERIPDGFKVPSEEKKGYLELLRTAPEPLKSRKRRKRGKRKKRNLSS